MSLKTYQNDKKKQTVLILKYIIPHMDQYIYYGAANVGMNGGLMLR